MIGLAVVGVSSLLVYAIWQNAYWEGVNKGLDIAKKSQEFSDDPFVLLECIKK